MARSTGIGVLAIIVVTLIGNGEVGAQMSALDRIRGNPALLARADVWTELSLTAEQIGKVADIDHQMRERIVKFRREAIAKFDALPEEQRRERQREVGASMRAYFEAQWDEVDKKLRDVLSADQWVRFKQLDLQHRAASAFRDPSVQLSLRLTEEQVAKVKQIFARANAQTPDIRKFKGDDEERRRIWASLARANAEEAMRSCIALLTEEQKKDWKAMTGKPFDFEPDPMAP